MEMLQHILAGAGVGFAVGLTGIGGGSLMTPLLLLFGYPAHVAIGTDLLYAAITKAGGVVTHKRQGTVRWRVVFIMAAGSLPASILTGYYLSKVFDDKGSYADLLTTSLGVMLVITATVILLKKRLQNISNYQSGKGVLALAQANHFRVTFVMGIILGVFVTLTSVGAGAFGTAVLLVLYPRMPSIQVVGTDIAHAVPLTLVAGMSHLFLGHVDFELLIALLIGSLPAIHLGTKVGARLPDDVLQKALAVILLAMGTKYVLF